MSPPSLSEDGFTLAEILIVTVILSVSSLAVFTLISLVNNRSAYILALKTRDSLQIDLMRTLEDEKAISETRARDTIFNNCFRLAKVDRGCPGQSEIGISLFNASGDRVGGPPNAPVYYTMSGQPCKVVQGSTNVCPIQVTTTVRAQGIPLYTDKRLVTNGDIYHELVEIRYAVTINDTPSIPKNQRSLTGSYVIDTQDQMSTMPRDDGP